MRIVKTDGSLSMRGDVLKATILEDKAKGLIPFFVSSSLIPYIYLL